MDEERKEEIVPLVIKGYNTEDVCYAYIVAECIDMPLEDIIAERSIQEIKDNVKVSESIASDENHEIAQLNRSNVYELNGKKVMSVNDMASLIIPEELEGISDDSEIFENIKSDTNNAEGVSELAEIYCISEEAIGDYVDENQVNVTELKESLINTAEELGVSGEYSLMAAVSTASDSQNLEDDTSVKTGPFNVKKGVNDSVETGTGELLYIDNICSLPGINGLDLNLSLRYSSNSGKFYGKSLVGSKAYNWSFNVPSILNQYGEALPGTDTSTGYGKDHLPRYIVLSDGSQYKLSGDNINGEFKVENCFVDNLKLTRDTNSVGGAGSKFALRHKDGKIDYFDQLGGWIATKDRFNNKIYKSGNNNDVQITDTRNQVTTLTWEDIAENPTTGDDRYLQTISLPDGTSIKYTYENRKVRFSGTTADRWRMCLVSKEDQNGDITSYESEIKGNKNYSNVIINKITYPTGMKNEYVYESQSIYNSSGDTTGNYYYRVKTKKITYSNGDEYNKEDYTYSSNNYTLNAEAESKETENNYSTYVTDTVRGLKTTYNYNKYGRNTSIVRNSTSSGNDVLESINYTYNSINKEDPYPKSVKTVSGSNTVVEEISYLYGDVAKYKVMDGDSSSAKILSQSVIEYDYNGDDENYYGLVRTEKHTISKGTNSSTLRVVNNYFGPGRKYILDSKMRKNEGGEIVGYTYYVYDGKGRMTKLRECTYYDKITGAYDNNIYIDTVYEYDTYDVQPKKITKGGVSTQYTYDCMGRVATSTDGNGKVKTYSYDDMGSVRRIDYSGDQYISAGYEEYTNNYVQNTTIVRDANGNKLKYYFDNGGNLISVVDVAENNPIEMYTYDRCMRRHTYNTGYGTAANVYGYDWKDRVTSEEVWIDGIKLRDVKNTYTNTAKGLEIREVRLGDDVPSKSTVVRQYDKLNRLASENNNGRITEYTYDMLGNVLTETTKDSSKTYFIRTYTYGTKNELLSEEGKEANGTPGYKTYTYDMAGRMLTSTDAMNYTTTYEYYDTGNVKQITMPLNSNTDTTYTAYTYDGNGNVLTEVTKKTAGSVNTKSYIYNCRNNLVKATVGNTYTSYEYDQAGNITAMITGNGTQRTEYTYDQLNRQTAIKDALGQSQTFTYDLKGDMINKVDRNGNTTNYVYDGIHRVTNERVTKDGSTITKNTTYSMTGGVKDTSITSSGGYSNSINYQYNEMGLVRKKTSNIYGKAYSINYYYDSRGNNNKTLYTEGSNAYKCIENQYDDTGRLTYVYDVDIPTQTGRLQGTYNYDRNNNVTKKISGNGIETWYTYNGMNMLKRVQNKNGNSVVSQYDYEYYYDGNQSKKTDNTGKVTTYTYDPQQRLITESETKSGVNLTKSYTYSTAGNRVQMDVTGSESYTTKYSYDKNNRMLEERKYTPSTLSTEVTRYRYDNNGNEISRIQGVVTDSYQGTMSLGISTPNEQKSYKCEERTYDGFNQLTELRSDGGTTASYRYDPEGLRVVRAVNGVTRYSWWDRGNIVGEMDGAVVLKNFYLRGNDLLKGYDMSRTDDVNSVYYLFNGHGDVTQLTNSSKAVTKSYEYDAFGVELNKADNDTNPWRYCGEYYDKETDSIYLRARYYNPAVGRFTSEDVHWNTGNMIYGDKEYKETEIRYPDINVINQSNNLYIYCMSNPLAYLDSMGELAYPGQIHNLVVKVVAGNYGLATEQTILYKDSVRWGRADLIDPITGEVWDVKPATGDTKKQAKYYAQVQKYVDNTWKANPNQQLRTGSAKIAGGQFYFDSGYDQYHVTYSYTGGGIISYEYTKVTDWDQVKEDALVAGTVIITIVAGVAVISTAGSAGAAAGAAAIVVA